MNLMRKLKFSYPLILLTCWTGLVVAGTYALIETTVRQHLAMAYPSTMARIIQSEVGRGAVSRRGVEMEYNYSVDGVNYTGHAYRYDDHNMSLDWDVTVEDHPKWSAARVYYNPKDPSDALLEPGIDGGDLLLLLFAVPVLIITGTLWISALGWLSERSRVRPAGGVKIVKQPSITCIALAEVSPIAAGLYGLAGGAFFAAFPIVIYKGYVPSVTIMAWTWVAVAATGIMAFLWCLVRNGSGIFDLSINHVTQMIVFPQTAGRHEPVTLPRHEVAAVSLQRRITKGPSGTHLSFLPAINRCGPRTESQPLKLVTWGWSLERAEAFTKWLSQELDVEFKGIEEELNEVS